MRSFYLASSIAHYFEEVLVRDDTVQIINHQYHVINSQNRIIKAKIITLSDKETTVYEDGSISNELYEMVTFANVYMYDLSQTEGSERRQTYVLYNEEEFKVASTKQYKIKDCIRCKLIKFTNSQSNYA